MVEIQAGFLQINLFLLSSSSGMRETGSNQFTLGTYFCMGWNEEVFVSLQRESSQLDDWETKVR